MKIQNIIILSCLFPVWAAAQFINDGATIKISNGTYLKVMQTDYISSNGTTDNEGSLFVEQDIFGEGFTGDGDYELEGDWNADLIQGNATITFSGNQDSEITTQPSFYNFHLAKTNGNHVTIQNTTTIRNELSFSGNGNKIITDFGELQFTANAFITGYDESNFIETQ